MAIGQGTWYNPWQFAMPTSPFWGQPPVNRTMVRNRDWMYDDTNPYVPPGVGGDGRGGQTGGGGYSDGSLPGDGRGASGGGGGEVDTGGRGGAYRGGGTTSTSTVTYDGDGNGRVQGNTGGGGRTGGRGGSDADTGLPGDTSTTTTTGPWWANDPQQYWDLRNRVSSLSVPPAGWNPWANWANSALSGMQGGYNNATQNWGAQNQQWPVSYKDWTNGAYGQPSLWQGLQRGASNVAFGDNRRPFDHIGSGPSSGTNPWAGGNTTNLIRRPPKGGPRWV